MSNEVEQDEEIEVLMSIFPSEFEMISDVAPKSFKIHIVPGTSEDHVAVALVCKFTVEYPSSIPNLEIEIEKGLGRKHADELKGKVIQCATDNVGMPSIFTITELIKEWLSDNNIPGQDGSMYAEMMRRSQQKDVETKKKAEKAAIIEAAESESKDKGEQDPAELERIRKRQAGTVVTLESFLEWKTKFEAEQREKELSELGGKAEVLKEGAEERLSGKQLFLLNKVGQEDEEELIVAGEQEELPVGGGASTAGATSLDEIELALRGSELGGDDDDENDSDYVDEGGDDDDGDDDFEGDDA